jgi:hypothetical protein
MEQKKIAAWKNVRNAGTVSLVTGWLGVASAIFVLIAGLIFAIANYSIPSDTGGEPFPSAVLGIIFIVLSIFVAAFSVIYIVAGIKLRKPIAKPKGWLIFIVVMGALSLTSILGILLLVFGILGLSSYHEIEGTQPPESL